MWVPVIQAPKLVGCKIGETGRSHLSSFRLLFVAAAQSRIAMLFLQLDHQSPTPKHVQILEQVRVQRRVRLRLYMDEAARDVGLLMARDRPQTAGPGLWIRIVEALRCRWQTA